MECKAGAIGVPGVGSFSRSFSKTDQILDSIYCLIVVFLDVCSLLSYSYRCRILLSATLQPHPPIDFVTTTIPKDGSVSDSIFRWDNGFKVPVETNSVNASQIFTYAPIWQTTPPDSSSINADLFSEKIFTDLLFAMLAMNQSVLSSATEVGDMFDFVFDDDEKNVKLEPHAYIMEPVYSDFSFQHQNSSLVGILVGLTKIGNLLDRLLPQQAQGIVCVISDACGKTISFNLNRPDHNFDHASHVVMSVSKMLGRIADSSTYNNSNEGFLQDKSYGIASDPLAQFACLFSALIHNVDHSGVPNTQLVKESATVVTTFGTQSVAEQNSVDVAWTLLLQPQFESLHGTICATKCEAERFRQLVVNDVLATDMLTPDLNALRENRWNQAFADTNVDVQGLEMSTDEIPKTMMKRNAGDFVAFNNNRKATVVMEHLWQASNVCHTMQHWQIYRKWNERLFLEVSKAFLAGRADCDPAETWYQNELAFFDSTVIPLAKKLEQCGVFVVSSDEYLNYAIQNRAEWHARGVEIVHEMVGHHSLK